MSKPAPVPEAEIVAHWQEENYISPPAPHSNCPDKPKTRSGKIIRRVLGAISNKDGDISTLASPEVVDEIGWMPRQETWTLF